MQLNCGEDVSSAAVDEWTGRVMRDNVSCVVVRNTVQCTVYTVR